MSLARNTPTPPLVLGIWGAWLDWGQHPVLDLVDRRRPAYPSHVAEQREHTEQAEEQLEGSKRDRARAEQRVVVVRHLQQLEATPAAPRHGTMRLRRRPQTLGSSSGAVSASHCVHALELRLCTGVPRGSRAQVRLDGAGLVVSAALELVLHLSPRGAALGHLVVQLGDELGL